MPHRKKYYRKRKKATAADAMRLAKKALAQNRPELKFVDTTESGLGISRAGLERQFGLVAQGDGDNERIGDTIRLTSLHINGNIFFNTAVTGDQIVRMLVVWFPVVPATGSGPIEVLSQNNTVWAPYGHKHFDNRFNFKILKDKSYRLNTQIPVRSINMRIPLKKAYMQYDAPTAGSTDITRGVLKVMFWTDSSPNLPVVEYASRTYYLDN